MPDDIKNPQNPKPANQGFVTKPIENPILGTSVREQIAPSSRFSGSLADVEAFYRANKIYFWAIIAGALVIGILAYFAFKKTPAKPQSQANVTISVSVPEKVPSGSEAVYKITIQNQDSQKLVNLDLELAYPDGLKYQSSSPAADNITGTVFKVPDLISGQNAAVFVKTIASGNVGEQKTLTVKLHYKYANFNSEFIKQELSTVTLTASDVSVELEGPAKANNAQLVLYTVKYQNNSGQDLKSARIKIDYPPGFVFASAAPPPSLGSDTWDLGAFAQNASGNIQIQGTFTAISPGESKTATAKFLILGNDGQYFIQNSSSFTTAIESLPLLVSQELAPANESSVINPGDNLVFSIRYQNNGSVLAHGVNIAVSLDSKVADLSSISAEGAQINNNSIIWNAASVSQLESLAPNESGQLRFSLKINNPATKDSSENLTLVSNIKIKSDEYESFFPGNALSLKVSSPAAVTSALNFVSGQLPPQVGKATTYKVKLMLNNASNDFTDGELTAFIPLAAGGFVSSSVTPAEKDSVQFEPSSGKLTWKAGSLPAYAGRFGSARLLEFQVILNPSAAQAGKSVVLVKSINFTAKDSFTGQGISLNSFDINTSSLPGNEGYTNGTVVP